VTQDLPLAEDGGIRWQVADGVARLTLISPEEANTIGYAQSQIWPRAFEAVVAARPRVIVLAAEGRIFCAGGAIKRMAASAEALGPYIASTLEPLHAGYVTLASAPCPIVSVVQGPIGGAGIGLALLADLVLASTSLKLRAGYPAIGLSPDLGASYFLARRVGTVRAQRWLLTNAVIGADDCLAAGAVDELHAPEALAGAAERWVEYFRTAAPASMAAIKQLGRRTDAGDLAAHIELEKQLLQSCAETADAREGVLAFLARRSAHFQGR